MNTKQLHKEMKENKKQLIDTFEDKVLPNIQLTKKELEELRAQMEGASPERLAHAELEYNVRKKLSIINREADLHEQLDQAIDFLGKLIQYYKQ
jgi:hypothetical protein